jgi:hypothetical protein
MPATIPIAMLDVMMIWRRTGEARCPTTSSATSMRVGVPSMICTTPGAMGCGSALAVTPTFYKNENFCPHRGAYKKCISNYSTYEKLPKINLV